MPEWLLIVFSLFGAGSGLAALVGGLLSAGRLMGKVDAIAATVSAVPQLSTDVAYLRGRMEGADAAIDMLQDHALGLPRNRRRAAQAQAS